MVLAHLGTTQPHYQSEWNVENLLYIEPRRSMKDNAQLRDKLHHIARQVTILESQQRIPSSPDVAQPTHPINTDPN